MSETLKEGDFSFIKDKLWRDSLEDAYEVVSQNQKYIKLMEDKDKEKP